MIKPRNVGRIIAGLILLTFMSCATLLNGDITRLEIVTTSPATLVLNNDTLKSLNNRTPIKVIREAEPLSITIFNDSIVKKVNINYKSSFAYWANLGFFYGAGMLIDMNNPRRYTYPKTVYVDMNSADNGYTTLSNAGIKNSFQFKINPLKLIDVSNPALELSAEKGTGNRVATQLMASYLLPSRISDNGNDFKPNIKGYRIAVEEKYYLKKQAPVGSYVSFELNYMKNKYTDILTFGSSRYLFLSPYDSSNIKDTLGIKKQTFSINCKFGHQLIIKKLSIDLYAGLGMRYKDVKYFDGFNPDKEREKDTRPNDFIISDREGKYWIINFPIGFKLGLVI